MGQPGPVWNNWFIPEGLSLRFDPRIEERTEVRKGGLHWLMSRANVSSGGNAGRAIGGVLPVNEEPGNSIVLSYYVPPCSLYMRRKCG